MPNLYCHECQALFQLLPNAATSECPQCGGGFVEVQEGGAPPRPAQQPFGAAAQHPGTSYSRTFTLPGGGQGSFRIITSTSTGGRGGSMPVPMPGMPVVMPGFGGGGGAAGDQFVRGVLEALTGGGFLHPGHLGGAGGGGGNPFTGMPMGGMHGGGGEQEWLDQLMSQIMAEYEPPSQAASQRAVRSLPRLAVRAKDAQGEPGEGEAIAKAGEPCSVCHDEFRQGEEVLELPCSHNYHPECLTPWLETHNTCPVCRHELPAEDERVEAARRQRVAASGSGSGDARQAGRQHAQHVQQGGGGRLNDLLSNISERWESFRSGGGEAPAAAGIGGGASSGQTSAAAAAPPPPRPAGSSGGIDATTASTSARPPLAAGGNGGSTGGLRQRREAAAAAAERRLRGEQAAAAPGAAPAAAQPHQAVPPRPQPAQLPPHPAARSPEEQEEEEGEGGGVVAGAIAGGVLGALAGAALMLLGARGRRDRD